MAQIDATGLIASFSAFDPNNVSFNTGTSTPFSYMWSSANSQRITALSYLGDITSGLAGTTHAINITDSSYAPILSISGLNTPLTSLVDAGNIAINHEKFWNTVLAGDTEIFTPSYGGGTLQIMGDFVRVGTGQTLYGGDDSFLNNTSTLAPSSNVLLGDAITVNAGGTLYGGVDRFINVTATTIVGDVGNGASPTPDNSGTVYGGDDIVDIQDTTAYGGIGLNNVIGDVFTSGIGSSTYGGNDTITLTNLSNTSNILGDVYTAFGALSGGDDSITLQSFSNGLGYPFSDRPPTGFSTIAGDAYTAVRETGSPAFSVFGGNDTLTVANANGINLTGDFNNLANVDAFGGDDLISFTATRYEFGPTNVSYLIGDVYDVTSEGEDFTGGDDVITVSNASIPYLSGDVYAFTSTSNGRFHGGDDRITFEDNNPLTPSYVTIFGDAVSVSTTGAFNSFGNDVIELGLSTLAPVGGSVYGDAQSVNIDTSVEVVIDVEFGDDIIRVTQGHSAGGVTLQGDANVDVAGISGGLVFVHFGDDVLQGGAGNDLLIASGTLNLSGISLLETTVGSDTLDGGLGNDTLNGEESITTASYASVAQAVTVFLDGIPGTDPSNPIHAIGQGNDQLISVENVIGSSRNDVIVGTSDNNIIEGGAGSDNMVGNGGTDTLSYASSTGFVNVSLATGYAGGGSGSHAIGDTFLGGGGANSFRNVIGSDHDDLLNGDAFSNALYGGAGDDVLRGRGAGDTLDGGAGEDWIDYSDNVSNINVSLATGFANGGVGTHALGDVFIDVENIRGSNFGDRMTGDSGDNVFEGRAGNDSLFGGAGSDTADYASSAGFVNVSLASGFVGGGAGSHAIGDTFDSIENLRGSAHNDILSGDGNDNILRGRAGADTLNGNGGFDTADYADSAAFVNVSLLSGYTGGGAGSHAIGDVLNSIENLAGSAFNDILNGDNNGNVLQGRAGADVLRGNGGADAASYTDSDEGVIISLATGFASGGHAEGDTFDSIEDLIGSQFDDVLSGDSGANVLIGGAGDDVLRGRLGADELLGGQGSDTADYADASGGVNVSLNSGYAAGSHAAGDTFSSIENLTGSAHNDTLSGDGGANVLTGLAGDDSLRGFGGNDTFVFGDGFGNDTIGDFEDMGDLLDFSSNSQVNGITDLVITNVGADALVTDAFGNSILLQGEANNISGADFIF